MAVAYTDTVLNYSGLLKAKSDNNTRLLDAVFSRGRKFGEGVVSTGVRKVNSTEFALASGYSIGDGSQPSISEQASVTAVIGDPITRSQDKNFIQIFQEAIAVSYLKQSAVGNMAGINIAGQYSNVNDELDFQVAGKMAKMKKDLNYTLINGKKAEATTSAVAAKSGGIIEGIKTNAVGSAFTKDGLNAAIVSAMANGFSFADGSHEIWVNPADLALINSQYTSANGFGLPASRTEGGEAITSILTNFGTVRVDYDAMIPQGTVLLLNMNELAIAELDVQGKGCWFYEALAKTGAAEQGQLYGQAGIDFGAEWSHIKFTAGA
jgi:hypothetical protein